ncbi:MAG: carbohydrate binding domain-containing protein [Thermoguttaceae bacterium]|nr:carbohydrate binding domain-containing protein [Thermoguttaceae bacterium]
MKKILASFVFCVFAALAGLCFAQGLAPDVSNDPALFPFVISYDGPQNATSMAHLLDAPAGNAGFVRVENGHFVNDKGRVRLHATNLTGPANFPTHEEADKLADRLARFGINCVRLHYFDSAYGTFMFEKLPGIIEENENTQKILSKSQRDRQDYMIAAFKKHGIYVDMNLHVARFWDERDGFVHGGPWANKGTDNFVKRMIEEQKIYARELLTHVNPYTGLAYTDEPAIAVIEINNENSLWANYRNGGMDNLPKMYADEFQEQWNDWLLKKYGTDEKLREAWQYEPVPLHGEQIPEGKFTGPVDFTKKPWTLYTCGKGTFKTEVEDGVLKLEVTASEGVNPKIHRAVKIKKGGIYTFSFKIRRTEGTGPAELGTALADYVGGFRTFGLFTRLTVGKEWKTFTFPICVGEDSDGAELQLTRFPVGKYEIKDFSFQSGAEGYELDGSLKEKSIKIVKSKDFAPAQAQKDFAQFISDTEYAYWTGMCNFIHDELHAKQPVSGTQLNYSPSYVQGALDYVDHHAYWLHPSVKPDWEIGNTPMVNSSSNCVTNMAAQRVAGKPFTVSEYNHPFPNYYGAEGQPMLRAYGAFQDWDGVFEYTYNHCPNFEPIRNSYFFSMICRTDVLAHIPACAAMFLRGDVQTAKECVTASFTAEKERARIEQRNTSLGITGLQVDSRMPLIHRTQVEVNAPEDVVSGPNDDLNALNGVYTSDTGELVWNLEKVGKGVFLVKSKNTKLFSGFPEGRTFDLADGVTLAVGKTMLGWATISMTSQNAKGFGKDGASRILLTATGYCGNKGQIAENRAENGRRIHFTTWGEGPIVAEGIPAELTLPAPAASVKVFALDPHGDRKAEVPVKAGNAGNAVIQIGPEFKTVWYEIEIQ